MKQKEYDRCLRCGRKLKNPLARHIGYGDICYRKIHSKKVCSSLFSIVPSNFGNYIKTA